MEAGGLPDLSQGAATAMIVDIVFCSYNRLAFTEFTFDLLLRNTDWDLVSKLFVYDDDSDDGTLEFLTAAVEACPAEHEILSARRRSPVAVMNHYAAQDRVSDVFCKIDNDVTVPPGWLGEMLGVLDRHPDLEVLGMEAGLPDRYWDEWEGPRSYTETSHIGGVGAIRTAALTDRPSIPENGRYGWTEWQMKFAPARGWVTPCLPVCQLDRVPCEPWQKLSWEYMQNGWQRSWPPHDPDGPAYWDWFTKEAA